MESVGLNNLEESYNTESFASGVFLCIRCSGIHRGMGTHISKVKSVDLDAWTPEQMEVLSLACVVLSSCQLNLILQSPVDTEMGQQTGQSILGGALKTRARSSRSVSPFSVLFYISLMLTRALQ